MRAFLASVLGTGMSRVLGAARDIAIADFLGASAVSDAFWIAFTIPNTFRRFVADEGLTGALIPAIAQAEAEEGEPAARQLGGSVLVALLLANVVLIGLGELGAEWVVRAFAYAFTEDPEQLALTVSMTRWLFPFLAMVSVVSWAEGLLNHRGHFFLPKLAPGLVSAGIVTSVLFLGDAFAQPVYAVVAGTLVGGMVHVLVVLPPLVAGWGTVPLSFALGSSRLHGVLRELGKVVVIGLMAQVNILVLRQLAASQGTGAITWYWNANRIVDLAQGMIAVAIGSALLPTLSQAVASADWDRVRADITRALRLAGFLLVPAAAILLAFSQPVTAILFRHGKFTWEHVEWTALTLVVLVPYFLSLAGINIVKKVYFALEDRNTLLAVGVVGVLLTAGLGFALSIPWGLPGLAAALSVSTVVQLVAYVVLLRRRLGTHLGLGSLAVPFAKMTAAAVPVGLILWGASLLGEWERGPTSAVNVALVAGGLAVAGVAYLIAAKLLRIQELERLLGAVRRKLGR